MQESELQKLKDYIGEEYISTEELDLIVYTSDLAALPSLIKQFYKIKKPCCILRPANTEQVAEIVKFAVENKIPFTSRAGASSGMGGVVPIDGGIILDLTRMQEIIAVDAETMHLTVQPGMTWRKLIYELDKMDLIPKIYPSSAPSATVGGFIATGGYAGIGAPKYGAIGQQIQSLRVVLPSGKVSEVVFPFTSLFVGSEGTLGVVTEITMKVCRKGQVIHPLTFGFETMVSAVSAISEIAKSGIQVYHLIVFDRYFLDVSRGLGENMPPNEVLLLLVLEGSKSAVEGEVATVRTILKGANEISAGLAWEEWDRRFKAELFVKRAGPSLILVEIGAALTDVPQIYRTLRETGDALKIEQGFCAILGQGLSMLCMPFVLTDERRGMDYLKILAMSRRLISKALERGGVPYGIGLWNTAYLNSIYDEQTVTYLSRVKSIFDPNNLCNPGKMVEDRTPEQMRL